MNINEMKTGIKVGVNREGIRNTYDKMMKNIINMDKVCVHIFYDKHRTCWIPNSNLLVRFTHEGKFLGAYTKHVTIDDMINSAEKHNGDIHMCLEHRCAPVLSSSVVLNKGLKEKYIHILEYIAKYNWTQPKGYKNSLEIKETIETKWDHVDKTIRLLAWDGDTPVWHPEAKELIIKYYVDPSLLK